MLSTCIAVLLDPVDADEARPRGWLRRLLPLRRHCLPSLALRRAGGWLPAIVIFILLAAVVVRMDDMSHHGQICLSSQHDGRHCLGGHRHHPSHHRAGWSTASTVALLGSPELRLREQAAGEEGAEALEAGGRVDLAYAGWLRAFTKRWMLRETAPERRGQGHASSKSSVLVLSSDRSTAAAAVVAADLPARAGSAWPAAEQKCSPKLFGFAGNRTGKVSRRYVSPASRRNG